MREGVLLVILDGAAQAGLQEALRIGVGLLAADRALHIWSESPLDTLGGEAEIWLDALAEEGVSMETGDPAVLHRRLQDAGAVLRVAAASRSASPALLTIDDAWLAGMAPGGVLGALREAGQVIRRPSARLQK